MKSFILAAITVLGLGFGSAFAATPLVHPQYQQDTQGWSSFAGAVGR
jgi:hypothetical protein